MNNHYRTKYQPLLIIAIISAVIPLGVHKVLNSGTSNKANIQTELSQNDIALQQTLHQILLKLDHVNTSQADIEWINSPVMQSWIFNEKSGVWETVLNYKDSFRSSPTLILGLRQDGTVVWKRITK